MTLAQGKILLSSPNMEDPVFQNAAVFIAEYNADGALGFVINKIFERPLNELVEFRHSPPFPLYKGGPVDVEHLYFIHRRADLIHGGTLVVGDVYFGGDFKQAVTYINNGNLTSADIRIFLGYCGWDANELEAEIAEGSWRLSNVSSELVFADNAQMAIVFQTAGR